MRAFVRKYEVFVKTKLTVKPIDWKTIKDQTLLMILYGIVLKFRLRKWLVL